MVNNSINIKKNSHLNSLNIKKTIRYDLKIQVLDWDRHKNVAG